MTVMKINLSERPKHSVSALLLFFVIHSVQVGVGLQGFQRAIYKSAGHDAWISVFISGIWSLLVLWIMVKTLSYYKNTDLYGIHYDVFGKWIGGLFSALYMLYCLFAFFIIIRNYVEVIQAWLFPQLAAWFVALTLVLMVIYTVTGGIRVLVGICFFSVIFSAWLLLLLFFPIEYADWRSLLPIMEADVSHLMKGAYKTTFTIVGLEVLYILNPYIKEKEKTLKFSSFGLAYTLFVYLAVMVVSLVYFSGGQLENTIWATLTLFKIIHFPFVERFEYLAITFWMLIILPNLGMYLWCAVRGMSRVFHRNEKSYIYWFSLLIIIPVCFVKTTNDVNMLNGFFAKIAFVVVFCYPFLLFAVTWIKKTYKERIGRKS
ncbi:spore germination protein (amino acid permease) [Fictibacillus solisalsi]|uniref:Spore germination protein (Amino acid permease) n=2 Tax=Fictibacillus solisalsi TaxID=459525 RepID=A0A1G9U7Q7_9BACL|nr:spore germination protein (amino acid permease) [Fictibacillus solisalsi]